MKKERVKLIESVDEVISYFKDIRSVLVNESDEKKAFIALARMLKENVEDYYCDDRELIEILDIDFSEVFWGFMSMNERLKIWQEKIKN